MNLLRKLYDWTLEKSKDPKAPWFLAIISFSESSFFPIPPDIILIPMVIANRIKAWTYATICTVSSVLGGVLGYFIGFFFYNSVGIMIIQYYSLENSLKSDWEVELGVIIGKETKHIEEKQSQDHIAGYCVVNDLSEREFQLEHYGQWVKGKSCDTFGPIGPYLVTKDEVADPQNLRMWLDVNSKRMQDGSTSTMVYGVNFLVSYLSQFMSLQPGDIISTGTPPGVGMGQKPPFYLKPGDTMNLGIEHLGEQCQKVINYSDKT